MFNSTTSNACHMCMCLVVPDGVSPTTAVVPPELTSRDYGGLGGLNGVGLSPVEVLWGEPLSRRVEPYSYWTLKMEMRESAYVNLNLSFPWGSNWALLFRKNAPPSITQHDLIKIVKNGRIEHRNKRRHVRSSSSSSSSNSLPVSINGLPVSANDHYYPFYVGSSSSSSSSSTNGSRQKREAFSSDESIVGFSEYLESGKWFLRIFNDDMAERRVSLVAVTDPGAEMRCPLQCTGNGNCVYGKCHCFDGFTGLDCSNSMFIYEDYDNCGGGGGIRKVGFHVHQCMVLFISRYLSRTLFQPWEVQWWSLSL
jgi:hypothetical protein